MNADIRIDEVPEEVRRALVERSEEIKKAIAEDARTDAVGELDSQRDSAVAVAIDKMRAVIWALPIVEYQQQAERLERSIVKLREAACHRPAAPIPMSGLPWSPMGLALTGFAFLVIGSTVHGTVGLSPMVVAGMTGAAGLTYLGIAGTGSIRSAVTRFRGFKAWRQAHRDLPAAEAQLLKLNSRIKAMETVRSEAMELVRSLAAVYDREFALARHALDIAKQFL